MNLETYFTRIDDYHEGLLSEEERNAFEADLQTDTELQQAFALYQSSMAVIEQQVEDALRSTLNDWESALPKGVHTEEDNAQGGARIVSFRSRLMRYSAAAAILLLAVFIGWQQLSNAYSNEGLYTAYYAAPEAGALRGAGTDQAAALEEAQKAYRQGQYQSAADLLRQIQPSDKAFAEAQYFLGHACVQLEDFARAREAFQNAANSSDIRYAEKGAWNAALCCLRTEKEDAPCIELIRSIATDPGHAFQKQAQKLERKLNAIWR